MALENNQSDGQTDITRFLEKFSQDVSSADYTFTSSPCEQELRPSGQGKQQDYERSFEMLEEKIRELEDKFETSSAVSEAVMRELARHRADAEENRKSENNFMANITATIANLKESVEKLSRMPQPARNYDGVSSSPRSFDSPPPPAPTASEQYLAMTHYRPETYRSAQQNKLNAARAEKEKAREELQEERQRRLRAMADLQSARSEKERMLFQLETERIEKRKALTELKNAQEEKNRALQDLNAVLGQKDRTEADLKNARTEKEDALARLNAARAQKDKAESDLKAAYTQKDKAETDLKAALQEKDRIQFDLGLLRDEKNHAMTQLRTEREEKARIISSLQQKASQLKAVNVALDREIKRAQQEKLEALRKSASQAKEILSLRDALTAAEERFKTFDFEGRVISIKRQYQNKVSTLETQLREISDTCVKQVEEIEALKAENLKLHKASEEREQLALQYEAKTRELEELRATVVQLRDQNDKTNQDRLSVLTQRMQRLQQEHEELSERLTQAQAALLSMSAEKQTLEDNFKVLLGKIEQNDEVIARLKQKITVLTEENNELRRGRVSHAPAVAAPVNEPKPAVPATAADAAPVARPASKTVQALHPLRRPAAPVRAPSRTEPSLSQPEPQAAPVEMQNTKKGPVLTEADLPEIRVADPVPQEELYNGEDFLEKTDSFIGRMKWSIFREDK